MSAPLSVRWSTIAGAWVTKAVGHPAQPHPSWRLAMLHAAHLITDARRTTPTAEHLATRVDDLLAWGWTVETIADTAQVPATVVSDLATLTVGKLRSMRIAPTHSQRITSLYRSEASR